MAGHVVGRAPSRQALITPARIAAAACRLRRMHAKASGRCRAIFGDSGPLTLALAERVAALGDATNLDGIAWLPVNITRVLFDMANVPRAAERLHTLATWMLAAAQAIEAEDAAARALAVDLGAIIAECELIATAAEQGDRVAA